MSLADTLKWDNGLGNDDLSSAELIQPIIATRATSPKPISTQKEQQQPITASKTSKSPIPSQEELQQGSATTKTPMISSLPDTLKWDNGLVNNDLASVMAATRTSLKPTPSQQELQQGSAVTCASTNPMPSQELQQRINASEPPKMAEIQVSAISRLFSIFIVRERDVQPDTRVVVCPSVAGTELETLSLPSAAGQQQVKVMPQSSKTTDFTLQLGQGRRCTFYNDVASDNIIAFNTGSEMLHFCAVQTDAKDGKFSKSVSLSWQDPRPLSPGCWRIMLDKDGRASESESDSLAEFMLFRRRFLMKKSSVVIAGSKRPAPDTDETKVAVSESQSFELDIFCKDNPMLDIRAGTKLSIRSPDLGDTFTISNLRDIVKRTVTVVFHGKHTDYGDTAVKVIKTVNYSPETFDIKGLVYLWKREVEFLQAVSHPSIIRLYGADRAVPAWPIREFDKGEVWLARVTCVQQNLCHDGIEGIVKRMVEGDPEKRISARSIMDELSLLKITN